MSRVDFYLLPDVDDLARRRFACRLAYKASTQGQRVHVHVDDRAAAEDLDELMWQYPAEFFIAHALGDDSTAAQSPVTIDHRTQDQPSDGLLINLSSAVPAFAGRFARIAEIVMEADRAEGRERFRLYRHDGHPLHHHPLEDWER